MKKRLFDLADRYKMHLNYMIKIIQIVDFEYVSLVPKGRL